MFSLVIITLNFQLSILNLNKLSILNLNKNLTSI